MLCFGTSTASRPEQVNLSHAAKYLSLHMEESCRFMPHTQMAQADGTVPQSHGLADRWAGEEVRSSNTGQRQPLCDLNLLPAMGNRDYPPAHTQIIATRTPLHVVLLSQLDRPSPPLIRVAKPPSLHHPCQAADPPSLFPFFSQCVLPHTPKAFLPPTHSSANRDHCNISREHLQRKPFPARPI